MGILSGVVSYLFGLALNLLDAMIDGFLGALGFDLDTFETYFPAARDYYDVIVGFAVGLLFIILIFQLFRNFGIMLDIEAEEPLKMLGKTALFYGMIISSRSITNLILKLLTDPYAIFLNAASSPYEFKLLTLVTSMFTSVFSNPFMAIVALILMLILGWQFLKLTIECVERYIVFYFVLYCAPVVFATGAFKSTAQIFKSWCRMLASQALLLLLNVWSIKLFISFMPVFESNSSDIIFNFLLGYAFLKFAQKADTLLRILGLNTASTGDMVRSLGGTIAGIAMTIKSLSSAAGAVTSAAGKIFGGASAAGGAAGAGAGGSGRGAGNPVGGMGGSSGPAPAGGSAPESGGGGVTDSGISSAKQEYVNDVLSSAKSQINGNSESSVSMGGGGKTRGGAGRQSAQGFRYEEKANGGLRDTGNGKGGSKVGGGHGEPADGNIKMGQSAAQGGTQNQPRIDAETREGLANIAHGLPHDKYDPVKKTYSGGGFSEFTGENANLIGASELTPAEGFEQHGVKMRDGSVGTLYQNSETGEAHLVQFGSVDNGVIQGTISEIDGQTGKMGDFMAFNAVHQSVPGAESFSGHSVSVADSEGGVYHVSTGASTSFFAPGGSSSMSGAAGSATPAAGSVPPANSPVTGSGASAPAPAAGGMGDTSSHHTSVSSHETSSIHTSGIGNPGAAPDVSGGGSSRGSGASRSEDRGFTGNGQFGGHGGDQAGSQGGSLDGGRSGGGRSAESPPVDSGIRQPSNKARRFSKNNPANVEVFKREASGVESFDRSAANPGEVPKMGSSTDK